METRVVQLEEKICVLQEKYNTLEKQMALLLSQSGTNNGSSNTSNIKTNNALTLLKIVPSTNFHQWVKNLNVSEGDFENLFKNDKTIHQCVQNIIEKNVNHQEPLPMVSFSRNTDIYIFDDKNEWRIMEHDDISNILVRSIYNKIMTVLHAWRAEHKDDIANDDSVGIKFNTAISRIMKINFEDMKHHRLKLREFLVTLSTVSEHTNV